MAKTEKDTGGTWLPLWMHLRDAAGIMRKLAAKWVPEAVYEATGLARGEFLKTAVFLGAIHDIGKATSYFQSIITKSCPEKREEIQSAGFVVNHEYRAAGKTPHAHAGQWILLSEKCGFGVHESLALVAGAHHGKPVSAEAYLEETDLLQLYPINFYGTEKESRATRLWEDSWQDILEQAMELAGFSSVHELPELSMEAQVLFSGLLIAADWLASNPAYFPLLPLEDWGEENLYPKRVNDGWERAALPEGWRSEVHRMDEGLFQERFGFLPNDVQKRMLEVVNRCEVPGIFILEAQMGIGKTEAALGAAEMLACRKKDGGIFFGLPTQATSNGLFGRLYEWGAKVSEGTASAIRLAHSSAEFQEDYHRLMLKGKSFVEEDGQEGLNVHPWFQGNKRALLADFVIGTVDQFLMASLKRKHFMLRHVGLAGKVVVIDECHAYDAYMNEYLDRSLQWMAAYGVPVILLSATLPGSRRRKLAETYAKSYARYRLGKRKPRIECPHDRWEEDMGYPLLTWTNGERIEQVKIQQEVPVKRVKLRYADSIGETMDLLNERLEEGGCACIIANTVRVAQEIYSECIGRIKDAEVILYHAQFIMPDRYRKERALLKRMGKTSKDKDRNRLILIGTQVLEQSLDYDADIMVTQLCPIDLLFQRIGRLHRHKRDGRTEGCSRPARLREPECIILRDGEEDYDAGSRAVYGDYLLMRTKQVLAGIEGRETEEGQKTEIKIPEDIPVFIQMVYNENENLCLAGEKYQKAMEDYRSDIKSRKERAKGYLLAEPSQKGIYGILDDSEDSGERAAEAAVRDGEGSIEVLLLKKGGNRDIRYMDDDGNWDSCLLASRVPDSEQGRKVAMQRLRLPQVFSSRWNKKETIEELEDRNLHQLPEWQLSPWIRGELILLLNQDNRTELNGYEISYSFEKGLEYIHAAETIADGKGEYNAGEKGEGVQSAGKSLGQGSHAVFGTERGLSDRGDCPCP